MPVFESPTLRLALGLGDQELEQRLRPTLETADDLTVVAQCLAADQLLPLISTQAIDAVVIAWTLHRLTDALLDQLDRPGLSVVLLVPDPREERWRRRAGPVLSVASDAETVHQAILASRPGGRPIQRPVVTSEPVPLKPLDRKHVATGSVLAIAGGAGAPGRTTVAVNLATALGALAPTVLVEIDLCAPSLAAYIEADPSRNICTLAHAVREDPRAWSAALADELQPLSSRSANAVVLCGPPKREMRTAVGAGFIERLVGELAQRYRWVVLDVGPEWLGPESIAATHRAALGCGQQLLLVTAADFVGLWHARTALDQLERLVGIERRRVQLVLNQHEPRFHHSRQEVEWHLGTALATVVPFDRAAQQRAITEQRPVVLDRSSRAGRALIALAEALSDGKVRLPQPGDQRPGASYWWHRLLRRPPPGAVHDLPHPEPSKAHSVAGGRRSAW